MREGYKMTELGEIPEEWEVKQLGDVAEIIMGQSPTGDSYNDLGEGIPLLNGPTEFTKKYPIPKQWTTKPTKLCAFGDILFCVRGSSTGRMNISNGRYCIGRGLASIKGRNNMACTSFVFQTLNFQLNSILNESAGSTFPNITGDNLRKLSIIKSPLKEQQKIADILSTVDEQIENTESLIDKTKELKKGLMQRLFTKGIGHTEFKETDVGVIPKEWEVKSLGKICKFSQGVQVAINEQVEEKKDEYVRFLRIVDYTQGSNEIRYIRNTEEKYCVNSDDIAMVRYGATAGFVGSGLSGVIANNMFKISPQEGILEKSYLFNFLKQDNIYSQLNNGTGASAMPAINFGMVSKILVPLPNQKEQIKISNILASVNEEIDQYQTQKQNLQNLKQSLCKNS